jgi:hypothetical protein
MAKTVRSKRKLNTKKHVLNSKISFISIIIIAQSNGGIWQAPLNPKPSQGCPGHFEQTELRKQFIIP